MKNNRFDIKQGLLLGIYEEFETNDLKIEFNRINRGDCTEIVCTVLDSTDHVIYENSSYID